MMRLLWQSNNDDVYDQPDDDFVIALSSDTIDVDQPNCHKESALLASPQQTVPCWSTSFRDACISLQTLTATPHEVLEYLERTNKEEDPSSLELPKKSKAILWKSNNVVPTIIEKYHQQQRREQERRNAKERKQGLLTKVATQVLQRIFFIQDVEDVDTWKEENDDHSSEHDLGWQQEIANIDLAVQCCQSLVRHASAGKVLLRHGDSEHSVIGWIRSLPTELVSKLPDGQINVLVDALLEMKLARIVDDILAIGFSNDTDCDISMALFRIDVAVQATEASLEQWTIQRDAALTRAIQCKRLNRNAAAMHEMKRKALYESHLETTRGTLINLEQTRHAVQTAQSQAQLVRVLEETASTWKVVRQHGVTVEEVDDLALELAEELGHLNDDNSKLLQLANDDFSEEELLIELGNLTLADNGRIQTVKQSSSQSFAHETKDNLNDAADIKDENGTVQNANANEPVVAD
ncbi:hypothetical protein MHU86_17297 [Fragilaria crotonensis]|nr:hypothetical protein MHU86_17297 [Fragilaria crotonensis]